MKKSKISQFCSKFNLRKPIALIYIFIFVLFYILPLYLFLSEIISASFPFWFDPARDFLLAANNLKKPTLIGPPTGIPGVFYGPYWIWFLSFCLFFSKDPRFTSIVFLLIYFIFLPILLYRLSKILGKLASFVIWTIFVFSLSKYITHLWNPHIAPLLFFWIVYLLTSFSKLKKNIDSKKILLSGFLTGFLINFHFSFGIALLIAVFIYQVQNFLFLLIKNFRKKHKRNTILKKKLIYFALFYTGFVVAFIPFFTFELRHGFHQIKAGIKSISDAFIYHSASVGQVGLGKNEIISSFIATPREILRIPNSIFYFSAVFAVCHIIYLIKRKKLLIKKELKDLTIFILLSSFAILLFYLSSKNPVWHYHFIGVEVIFLLCIALLFHLSKLYRLFVFGCLVFLSSFFIKDNFFQPEVNKLSISSLYTKRYIVERIYQDVGKNDFLAYAYSPSIYTYDYDYLFAWLGEEIYEKIPVLDVKEAKYIYLIIPTADESIKEDFINYKTPIKEYKTVITIKIPDGTEIIKRKRIK